MRIIDINEGTKIPYEVNGTKITFDSMLTIDLSRYQKEEERVIDISLNDDDMLQMGLGKWYIANISLPPKEYELVENGTDENESVVYNKTSKILDMDKVTLTLWSLPYNYGYSLEGGF